MREFEYSSLAQRVTPVSGITEGGRKRTGTNVAVLPRVVVYDPQLTVSLPPRLSTAVPQS